jgi:hypothetical protein
VIYGKSKWLASGGWYCSTPTAKPNVTPTGW